MNLSKIKYVFFVLLFPLLFACSSSEEQSDIAFVKFFGNGTSDYGVDVCEYNNTIYVLSNAKDKDSGKELPYLYFFNNQGEFVDTPLKFDERSEDESAQKLLMDSEGSLYIISNAIDTLENETIRIKKIKNRVIVWDTTYTFNDLKGVVSLSSKDAILSGNEIAIVGNAKIPYSDNEEIYFSSPYFLRITLDGQFLAHKIIGIDNVNDYASSIIMVGDYYYFTGYTEAHPPSGISRRIWLVQVNNYGTSINSIAIGSARINEGLCLKSINNSIILASSERNTEGGISGLKIYKLDINTFSVELEGEIIETKNVVPADIILNNNGFVVISNKFPITKSYGNISINYYAMNGTYIAKKEFGGSGDGATLLQVSRSIFLDDELLIVGYNEFNENSDVALLKLNSNNDIYE